MRADVVIAGAGVIGLSMALELRHRGASVAVVDAGSAGAGASRAAAGMLAAQDPANPPALLPLSALSLRLYPEFLERIRELSGLAVPIQTEWTMERAELDEPGSVEGGPALLSGLSDDSGIFRMLPEQSLDPHRLVEALTLAVRAAGVSLREHARVEDVAGETFVDCTGAWCAAFCRPAKGQMLRVQMPEGAMRCGEHGNVVVRTPEIYIVPRLDGSAVIGATVEDAGFDLKVKADAIAGLRGRAARLLPVIADAPELESWAGLRPGTPDGLPVLGELERGRAETSRHFVACGHFRNGILLGPGTARVMAQRVLGEVPQLDLEAFRPERLLASAVNGMR